MSSHTKEQTQQYVSKDPAPVPATAIARKSTKTLIEEFGDEIQVDEITYLECIIARNRMLQAQTGQVAPFKWIKDIDNVHYKIFLNDQDFDQ